MRVPDKQGLITMHEHKVSFPLTWWVAKTEVSVMLGEISSFDAIFEFQGIP